MYIDIYFLYVHTNANETTKQNITRLKRSFLLHIYAHYQIQFNKIYVKYAQHKHSIKFKFSYLELNI